MGQTIFDTPLSKALSWMLCWYLEDIPDKREGLRPWGKVAAGSQKVAEGEGCSKREEYSIGKDRREVWKGGGHEGKRDCNTSDFIEGLCLLKPGHRHEGINDFLQEVY